MRARAGVPFRCGIGAHRLGVRELWYRARESGRGIGSNFFVEIVVPFLWTKEKSRDKPGLALDAAADPGLVISVAAVIDVAVEFILDIAVELILDTVPEPAIAEAVELILDTGPDPVFHVAAEPVLDITAGLILGSVKDNESVLATDGAEFILDMGVATGFRGILCWDFVGSFQYT